MREAARHHTTEAVHRLQPEVQVSHQALQEGVQEASAVAAQAEVPAVTAEAHHEAAEDREQEDK